MWPQDLTLQRFQLGRTEERGHLHQPRRRILAQQLNEALAAKLATQPPMVAAL
ncbi:MAG: hypothetical protein HYZ72_20495 [Deltaproteobacteria bacterium]|nr:hypothetical protein [Deltaproteobacteria bacterium]